MRLNLLSLWNRRLFTTKQSPARRQYLRALACRPDVNLHQTGPGFSEWNDRLTGMQNIGRLMPDCHAVISYKALSGHRYGSVVAPIEVCQKLLTIEQFNETWNCQMAGECTAVGIRLIVLHHENDRQRMKSCEDYGARIVHIPHCADPLFAEVARPWSEREGIVLTGVLNREHYPLRQRWFDLIQSGRIKGRYFRRPGNYTPSIEESDRLVREYAEALGSARVKLGCSSKWRYALNHQTEAAMSGVAHVCDPPECALDGIDRMMHAVEPDATDAELIAAVDYAMEHAEAIGAEAQRVALERYTTAHYAERLVQAILGML